MGIITVHDLRIRCIVGIHTHERKVEQDLFVDVRLESDFTDAADTDQISRTIDYTELARLLEGWARREKFKLIETLAVRACALICGKWPQIRRCRVTIKKPGALPKARYAAVTAEKHTGPRVAGPRGQAEA